MFTNLILTEALHLKVNLKFVVFFLIRRSFDFTQKYPHDKKKTIEASYKNILIGQILIFLLVKNHQFQGTVFVTK